MATITPTTSKPPTGSTGAAGTVIQTTWTPVAGGDICTAVQLPGFADRTVHVKGTFGGATVVLQGSNDNLTFVTLTDPLNNPVSLTAEGLITILQNPLWIRPAVTGGAGAAVTVILASKGTTTT